jgi:hypothetical protein
LHQLLDHLGRLDGAILVAADRLLQHLGERSRLHNICAPPCVQLALKQLAQQLHCEVLLGHAAHLSQELLRQDRDVGLFEARCGEDVHNTFRRDRA